MSDHLKFNKFSEDLTPMRALANFFDVATPVDSPDPEDLQLGPVGLITQKYFVSIVLIDVFFLIKKSSSMNQDGTPLAGSSQNSQRNKRKLADLGDSQQNASKKKSVDESNILPSDSILDQSEFPSQLESPSVNIPPRPKKANKKRMSTTQFTEAIESQTSQRKEVDSADGESSIPSTLGSPDEVLLQRPERPKKRISMSALSRTFGKKASQDVLDGAPNSSADSSSAESSGIPANLESPDYITSQQPAKSKKRVSSTGFRKVFDNPNVITEQQDKRESPEQSSQGNSNLSEMESPVLISAHRLDSKKTKKLLTTSFDKILQVEPQNVNAAVEQQEKSCNPSFNVSTLRSSKGKRSSMAASAHGAPDPPATQTIEETQFEDPNIPSSQPVLVSDDNNSDIDDYLSRSGEENTSDSLPNIVEFTSRVDEPAPAIETSRRTVAPEALIETPRENIRQHTPIRDKEMSTASTVPARSKNVYLESTVKLKQHESAQVQSKSHGTDSDLSDSDSDMQVLESPTAFSPIASSTQFITRQPSMIDTTATDGTEVKEQTGTAARKSGPSISSRQMTNIDSSSSNASASDIPSKLESPSDYKEYRRPGPLSSKKRISTTGFVAALSQKSSQEALTDSHARELSPLAPKTPVQRTPAESRRKSTVAPKVDDTVQVTRSSSRASSKSSPKRSAVPAISESGKHFKNM